MAQGVCSLCDTCHGPSNRKGRYPHQKRRATQREWGPGTLCCASVHLLLAGWGELGEGSWVRGGVMEQEQVKGRKVEFARPAERDGAGR